MLENIRIKNVALIEECEIQFDKGLNIISGETGSGKSMIIDSLNFALGERVNKDFLRRDSNIAKVEVLFSGNKNINNILIDNDIDIEYDNSILITRTLNSAGKSIFRINGNIVSSKLVRLISGLLIDIHGQHHNQSLLDSKKHIFLLDKFCGIILDEKISMLNKFYSEYKNIVDSINNINYDEMQIEQKRDMLYFQKEEIENANLSINEEEELNDKRKIISNSKKIMNSIQEILELLYEGNNFLSATDNVSKAIYNINNLVNIDSNFLSVSESLETVSNLLYDICYELKTYFREFDNNDDELIEIENRLSLIYNLKRKYGKSISDVLQFYNNIINEIDYIDNIEDLLKDLNLKKKNLEKDINKLCDEISNIRKEKAILIEKSVEKELKELEMKDAIFKINIKQKDFFTSNGRDDIEFLISTNLGEELKPLSKIASGGEMSRVMLALKTILSKFDIIETFIFDEIDIGISGKTAQKVAEKMMNISLNNQIICITHLPQIAAMGDINFLIEKTSCNNKTVTNIYKLDFKSTIKEIARLMGGININETILKAAEDMKKQAYDFKIKFRK